MIELDVPKVVADSEILRTVVGSGLHGIAIEGTDDHDEMGIFIEPPDVVFGVAPPLDHFIFRTQPEGARSGPGDIDRVHYSLRKYMRLAIKGNPTILLPLYADISQVLLIGHHGFELRKLVGAIVSRQVGHRFLGYMFSQIQRLEGTRAKHTNRPELIEKYGYDTKFASHALRLAIQGVELLTEGWLTLPMKDEHIEHILAIKSGQVAEERALAEIQGWANLLKTIVESGGGDILPEQPDYERINEWMVQTHLMYWAERKEAGL